MNERYATNKHSILSPSQHAWLNYDENKIRLLFEKCSAQERGTRLHELAAKCISEKIIPAESVDDVQQQTLHLYVKDAILFDMHPEQMLYFTRNAFGTADAIGFSDNYLRVFDLKTGTMKASMRQLWCYSALFFLSHDAAPADCVIENRIYQNGDVRVDMVPHETISEIMYQYVWADEIIENLRKEGMLWTT